MKRAFVYQLLLFLVSHPIGGRNKQRPQCSTSSLCRHHGAAVRSSVLRPPVNQARSSQPYRSCCDGGVVVVVVAVAVLSALDDSDADAGSEPLLYDLILTAETCYTESACRDVAALLGRLLKPKTGIALVATKRFYFGTGGGAACFKQACAAQRPLQVPGDPLLASGSLLAVRVAQVVDDGKSNIREVLEVTRLRS